MSEKDGPQSIDGAGNEEVNYDDDEPPVGETGPGYSDPDGYPDGTLEYMCDESRRVIDHQIEDLNSIDDKAVRTVRITVVILGFIFAVAQFEDATAVFNLFTVLGAVSLFASILAGVATYSYSPVTFGPGPEYLDRFLEEQKSEKKERVEALKVSADWMEENNEITEYNGTLLFWCQTALTAGLFFLLLGFGYAVGDTNLFGLAEVIPLL